MSRVELRQIKNQARRETKHLANLTVAQRRAADREFSKRMQEVVEHSPPELIEWSEEHEKAWEAGQP